MRQFVKASVTAMAVLCLAASVWAAPPKPGSVKQQADLVAKLQVHKTPGTYDGKSGVRLVPTAIVINQGQTAAKGFMVKLERKFPNQSSWQVVWVKKVASLGPGKSMEHEDVQAQLTWFPGDGTAGYRFKVDYTRVVPEKGENPKLRPLQANNLAVALYPLSHRRAK